VYALANMGHPSCFRFIDYRSREKNVEVCGIPHLAKYERDAPNFLFAALDKATCAPFFKGKAHEVRGTHQASQEIGGMGHPGVQWKGWSSGFGGRDRKSFSVVAGAVKLQIPQLRSG
jgi:hypothetical protein